jgi:hypothetical protein
MNEEKKYPVEDEDEQEEPDQEDLPEPIEYPDEVVRKGFAPWMVASKKNDPLRQSVIPLETEDEFLDIRYRMAAVGETQKIWGNAESLIAHVERDVERKRKKGEQVSKAVLAQLVHGYYLIGCIEHMVKIIDGIKVNPKWFQADCSQTLGNILQVWMNALLKHKNYPKPAWVLVAEGRLEEALLAEKRGLLVTPDGDPHGSSGVSDGEDGAPSSDPSAHGDGQ